MGLLSKITDWFTVPPGFDQPRLDPVSLSVRGLYDPDRQPDWYGMYRAPSWSVWDDPTLRADAVRKSIIVFACASYLADAVAEADLIVQRQIDRTWGVAEDRPALALASLLDWPNPHMDEAELLGLLVMQMAIQGYAVVEKVRNRGGLPVELWPLRPDWLAQRRSPDGTTTTYEYRVPGKPLRAIPAEDLIILPWRHDDRMERHGVSPVMVAAREIGIDASLTDFLKTFLDAGGIPPFVLVHDDPIGDDALVEAMQERWRQKYGGSKAYGNLPVLHGGYRLETIGQDINAMAWPDLRALTELKICQAFRVPADLVGAYETFKSGNLSTTESEGAMEQLQRYGAAPLRSRIAGALGRNLLPEFVGSDRGYRVTFDTSMILALQEDEDALHERIRQDFNAGLITLDEARQRIGYDDLASGDGDVFKVPFSVIMTRPEDLSGVGSAFWTRLQTAQPDGGDERSLKALPGPERRYRDLATLDVKTLEHRNRTLQRTQRDRRRLTEIGARQLRKFFAAQGERIAGSVAKSAAAHERRDIADIDWDAEYRLLEELLLRFVHANGEAAFAAASELLSAEIVWEVSNPRVLSLVGQLGRRIVGIHETTRADVAEIIADALVEGTSIPDLADRIRGHFTETYRGRAETIARTESMLAYADASILAYQESGEVDEVEITDNPLHTEAYKGAADGLTCAQRHGLVVPLMAGSFHVHSDHPNGSAAVLPILRTPLGET